jgi:Zn-dependent protease with chaperone function
VSVLGVSLFLYSWLYTSFSDKHLTIRQNIACLREDQEARANATTIHDLSAASKAFTHCVSAIYRPEGTFIFSGVGVLLALAVVLYLAMPRWRLYRGRLRPFTDADDPEVLAELVRLAGEAGLRRPPRFVWNPLNTVPTGLAFGRAGRRYVALSGALVTRYYTDRPAFRAVVLHELGHLRNRDVDQAYFTVVLWYAFVIVAIVPFVPTLFDESGRTIWSLGWRLAALTLLVYLTRSAVLRSREIYADVRASLGEPGGIRQVLSNAGGRRRWRDRLFALHPDPAVRLAAVANTDRLFSLGVLDAFGTGIAATIAYQEVVSLVELYEPDASSTMWWSALVFAPLGAAVLASAVWRNTFVRLARGERPRGAFAAGAALGAGFLLGQELSLSNVVGSEDVILGTGRGNVLTAFLVVAGLGLLAAWVAATAEVWLPLAGGGTRRWTAVATLAATGLVLTVAMGVLFLVRNTRVAIHISTRATGLEHDQVGRVVWGGPRLLYQFVRDPEIASFVHRAVVWPAIIVLWAYPLLALVLGRRGGRREVRWASVDGSPVTLAQPRVRLRRAALIGLAGASVVLLASLVLRAALHFGLSEATRKHDETFLAFYVWTVSLGLIGMAIVAAVTAATCRRAGVLLALFAAAVTGTASAITLFAYPTLASCVGIIKLNPAAPCAWTVDASFARQSFEQMLVQGTLAALAGAAFGMLGRRAFAIRRRAGEPEPATATY